MQNFYMMIGVPGAGKSYVANQLKTEFDAEIFSSDKYRARLLGDERDQSNNDLVFRTLHREMKTALDAGKSAIFDATNVNRKKRVALLTALSLGKEVNKVAFVVAPPMEVCIERDKNRARTVGERVIHKMVSAFQFPQYFEGWDGIVVYGYDGPPKYDIEERKKLLDMMRGFNQRNPHHKYDLLTHCGALSACYQNGSVEQQAGLFHDIAKSFSWLIKEDDLGYFHFPSHDCAGAYFMVSHLSAFDFDKWEDFYEAIFFINEHMHWRDIRKSDKTYQKYVALFGYELCHRINQFVKNDEFASGKSLKEHQEINKMLKEKGSAIGGRK